MRRPLWTVVPPDASRLAGAARPRKRATAQLQLPAGVSNAGSREKSYSTAWIADRASEWIRGQAGNEDPFFAFVSFPDPHHPFNPPGKYWSMYQPEQFEVGLPFRRTKTHRRRCASARALGAGRNRGGFSGRLLRRRPGRARGDGADRRNDHDDRRQGRRSANGAGGVRASGRHDCHIHVRSWRLSRRLQSTAQGAVADARDHAGAVHMGRSRGPGGAERLRARLDHRHFRDNPRSRRHPSLLGHAGQEPRSEPGRWPPPSATHW